MSPEIEAEWQTLTDHLDEVEEASITLSDALDIPYNNEEKNRCEHTQELFTQISTVCSRLQKMNETGLKKNQSEIESLDRLLKEFQAKYSRFEKRLKELDQYPCESEGKYPPVQSGFTKLQSKYLYCQAAGSDGSDGTSKGVHLRWTFRESLREEHLPKGDMAAPNGEYSTNLGHNRHDDFVYLYRVPYDNKRAPVVDFNQPPSQIEVNNRKREWHYQLTGFSSKPIVVVIRFTEPQLYDRIGIDPNTETLDFMRAYKGELEVEIANGLLMFAGEFYFTMLPKGCFLFSSGDDRKPARLYLETVSASHGDPGASLAITCRKTYKCERESGCTEKITCENIRRFRLKMEDGILERIKLEAYQDFFMGSAESTFVEKLSLTLDDEVAGLRLENPPHYEIDNQWPQYNDGTTVRADNYLEKWNKAETGIKEAVKRYLQLSRTDLQAVDTLPSDDPEDSSQIPISYLSSLNMISTDFHIARMLGMGHIDTASSLAEHRFVYIAIYHGKRGEVYPHENINQEYIQLAYMTLPTRQSDSRLPLTPEARQVSYGLNLSDREGENLYDEDGYSKFYPVRFVKIGRKKYDHEIPYESFFEHDAEFCICNRTLPVVYGIEYKKQGESEFRKPEVTSFVNNQANSRYLAHDTDHPEGVPETVPVQDNEESLFVHNENEEGVHCYGLYGINWFSRASGVGNVVCTDHTEFPKKNSLIPPSNLSVQYIQKEETLVFTSQEEQDMLEAREAANPGGDNNFVRVTFDYHHAHNTAYQRGHRVSFYFREEMPFEVRGKIVSEKNHNGNDMLSEVTLGDYTSIETGNPVSPNIPSGMQSRFVGGVLRTEDEQFVVVDVIPNTPYPKLVVERQIQRESFSSTDTDPETGETITTYHNPGGSPVRPKVESKFSLFENLAEENQWTRLNKEVEIIHFSNHTEQKTQEGGKVTTLTIGGIIGKAMVEDSTSLSGVNGIEGVFKVTFQSETLNDHPDSDVHWNKGLARIPTLTGEMSSLEVLRIESQNPLIIWVYDSNHATDPIQSGSGIDVNFHPGYKIFLYPEPANQFDGNHIKPSADHTKKTLIGVQSADPTHTPEYRSSVSVPAVLLAQRLIEPEPPGKPTGPTFATRPDFYGKSTYTFDMEVNTNGREPFGFIFFRADDTAVLNALYQPSTVEQITEDLENLDPNNFSVDRFNDLVNIVFDNDPDHEGEFNEYDGYRLPEPDKQGLLNGTETTGQKQNKLKSAVSKAFVPMTENPPLYRFIKDGRITEGVPPTTKDANGDLLDPSHSDFNPFPMVRKFSENGKSYVRFTDYTLDGTSVNRFFYYGVEISPQLSQSSPSPINGPIELVNSYPPEAPIVKSVIPQTANPVEQKEPAVYFEIEPYVKSESIKKVRIYRSVTAEEANSVRSMTLAAECPIDQIMDSFKDLPFPLFGEMIYYRLVALRLITNEQSEEEWVPSKPSDLFMTNLVDVVNPEAPELSYTHSGFNSDHELTNVVLSWEPTCYNGNYHLFKMTNSGQWKKMKSFQKKNNPININLSDPLPKEDENGELIYHHFKVDVENASGLPNRESQKLVI